MGLGRSIVAFVGVFYDFFWMAVDWVGVVSYIERRVGLGFVVSWFGMSLRCCCLRCV